MQDLLVDILLIIGGSVAGSFLGLLCYSRYKQHQIIDKIRCLVTSDVSHISNEVANIMTEISYEQDELLSLGDLKISVKLGT